MMELTTRTLPARKHIALVAHDHCKKMLMSWVERHQPLLEKHVLYATGTTGNLIQRATGMDVNAMLSGPMGGDQQVGALISEGKIDVLIFFWDPLKRGSARSGCESVAAPGDRLEYPCRHQCRHGGFHYPVATLQ